MKNVKIKLCLVALLSCNTTTPVEWTEQKQAAVAITSLVTACSVYNYIRYSYFDRPEEFYVNYSFPYAQLWYEDMIIKYPDAHLDTKRFLQAEHGKPKESIIWSMSYNNIYSPQTDLIYLDAMYKKKINNESLSDCDVMFANMIEWIVLHEAGHVELDYHLNELFLTVAFFSTFEAVKMLYKESTDTACKESIELALCNYISHDRIHSTLTNTAMWVRYIAMTFSEILAIGSIKLIWVRDQEAQADAFANKHASIDALSGSINFLQLVVNYCKDVIEEVTTELEQDEMTMSLLTYFNTTASEFARKIIYLGFDPLHPNPEYRIQSIRDEIEQRLQAQVVPE